MSTSVVCCVSTHSHLHHVLAMSRSIRHCWADQPAIFVLLLDRHDLARPGFEDLQDVRFFSPENLDIPDFDWLSLKFNAYELACACKPFVVRFALDQGHDVAWYVDSDMLFLADPASMRELAAAHDVVVTPHLFSAIPQREAWIRPTMGDVSASGLLNAGLFTARRGDATNRFLAEWTAMVVGPGACLWEFGSNQEQHAFNWVPAMVQDLAVCRDKRVNVAYWNLHERPLRWAHLDGGPKDQWLLDGEAISCFHFSGFNGDPLSLSRHDHRHRLGLNINLYHLRAHYEACLEAAGREHYAKSKYARSKIGDLVLSEEVRRHLRLLESQEKPIVDAWSDGVATRLADLLMARPGRHTLLPKMLEDIYLERPDLQALEKDEFLYLKTFLDWCRRHLETEYGSRVPLFRSSLLVVHRATMTDLARRCANVLTGESGEWIANALVHDRPLLRAKLQDHQHAAELSKEIQDGNHLLVATNPVIALRLMMQKWPELFRSAPALDRANLPSFRENVARIISENFIWPEAHGNFMSRLDPDTSLARVMSFFRRHPVLLTQLRRTGFSRTLLTSLVPHLAGQVDFDATDLALVDWYLGLSTAADASPTWRRNAYQKLCGIVHASPAIRRFVDKTPARARLANQVTASLLKNGHAKVSLLKRARRGSRHVHREISGPYAARLLPLLAAENDARQWQGYLAWWAERNNLFEGVGQPDRRALATLEHRLATSPWNELGASFPALAPAARGLNIFGYFKSPIGLGQSTRGVAAAQAANGDPYHEIVLTNMTMASDFRLEDLYPDFAFNYPRNFVVTYPHADHDPMDIFPAHFFRGRETIGYLAWEQRDLHPEWCKRLEVYDRLLAVSQFTADSVSRATGRDCHALPNVVQIDVPRAKAFRRGDFDLPEDAFIAGFMFDAASSVERKNPLAAARALQRAFRGRPDVLVVVKVTNGDRPEYRRAVEDIRALLADGGIRCRLITHVMPRAEVEGLMAQFDLYVSLHRSEGFGYTIAEAMWLGVPVVATGYSGNMDFMNEGNSYPVRYRETVVRESEGPFQIGTVWADPDIEQAADLCDHIYSDPVAACAKAAQAERDVRATVSVQAVAARLRQLLG